MVVFALFWHAQPMKKEDQHDHQDFKPLSWLNYGESPFLMAKSSMSTPWLP